METQLWIRKRSLKLAQKRLGSDQLELAAG